MTLSELVSNFIRSYRKPFTAPMAASFIGADTAAVIQLLTELKQAGRIKELSPGIFVKAGRYNPDVCYRQKGTWKFDRQAARELLALIERGRYTSIRSLAADFPRSRQWVYVYLEALASIDAIGFNQAYYVKPETDLSGLGKVIKKGILGTLNPKQKQPRQPETETPKEYQDRLEARKAEWERVYRIHKQANAMAEIMAANIKRLYSL